MFGWSAYPRRVRRVIWAPSLVGTRPQPVSWVSATTPSTCGYASSTRPRNWSAISRAVDAEQFTDVTMPT